jgi:heme exporter protein D
MIWDSWGDFFDMGGYALYVWGSIAMVAGMMLGETVGLMMRRKSLARQCSGPHGAIKRRTGVCL